jgi:hypothetical protein
MKNKNLVYLPNMQNFGIWAHFRNKLPNIFNGSSIIQQDVHFEKKTALKLDKKKVKNLKFPPSISV